MRRRSNTPGLQFKRGSWHLDKIVGGIRLCGSTGTSEKPEAELVLHRRIDEIRKAQLFGVRPIRLWREAATRYLDEYREKRSITRDAVALEDLDSFIGDLRLDRVHMDALQPYISARSRAGRRGRPLAQGTINRNLAVVRRITILASRVWRDPTGLTWLETAPLLQLPRVKQRPPYPLDWAEQRLLFGELAAHLERMALYKVNTGLREQEVCGLKWVWEQKVPGVGSVFVIPGDRVKNTEPRVVVQNAVAQSVIEEQRGKDRIYVFAHEGKALDRMHSSGWKGARRRAAKRYQEVIGKECPAGFRRIRVHDLKHTFGRRLRSAGVSLEDRQDLLGHKSRRITTHYSAAEIGSLVKAADLVNESRNSHALTLLRVV